MTEEFRAAFQRVLDTAASQDPEFPAAVQEVFQLSSQVPTEELAIATEALTPVLSDCEQVPGIAADLAVLAGALVEQGAPAGQVGLEVLRQLGSYGQAAVAFMHAWERTGSGPLPLPNDLSEADEKRVEEVLGDNAPLATLGWWTSLRYGLAAKAMLSGSRVRAAVRADSSALDGLSQIVYALSTRIHEFGEVNELLRMAEADTALVLDRASRRGFRVRFDGIGDNFQLHTLLADALVGQEGRLVQGTRPDPRWVAACLDAPADPMADVVRGEWDLVGGNGSWVGNEACPGDIPEMDGERVLVLEAQTLSHSWRAGRRHPQIPGSLEVLEELRPEETAAWWSRIHPAGSVRHPMAPSIGRDDNADRRPPRHFGVAAHFAEADSGPISAAFAELDPPTVLPSSEVPGTAADADHESADPPSAVLADPAADPWDADSLEELRDPDPGAWAPRPESESEPASSPEAGPEPAPSTIEPASEPSPGSAESERADDGPAPGARLLPPMPPHVSDSSLWAPSWRWPPDPPATGHRR